MKSVVSYHIIERTLRITLAAALLVIIAAVPGLCADEWPGQVNVAGFTVNNIRPQNASSAKGMLQIPGAGGKEISLTRSSNGEITGSCSINARVAGVDIQGDFKLDRGGLKCGGGAVKTNPKPIVNANITISSRGELSGGGRVDLGSGRVNINDFKISNGSVSMKGSASASASTDTQLAKYTFDGDLELQGQSGGSFSIVAKGQVERRGKLAAQVTRHSVSGVKVDPSNGNAAANIDGVNVTFDLF